MGTEAREAVDEQGGAIGHSLFKQERGVVWVCDHQSQIVKNANIIAVERRANMHGLTSVVVAQDL